MSDIEEITQVIAAYGPAVDSGDAEAAAALFTEAGWYEVVGGRLEGRQAIADMVRGDAHQGLLQRGVAHVMGLPSITVDGHRAVAVNHTTVYLEGRVWRVAANRWELAHTAEGWRISGRTNRLLDGSAASRDLLR